MHIKKGTIERKKRILSLLLCAALLCSFIPQGMAVASASSNSGLCEHHTEHTEDCGYSERTEGSPCTHDHTEDCYILAMSCVHSHDATCYLDETDLDNSATTSDMEWSGPITCTHVCSEESGCIIKELNCIHEHDNTCGYLAASEGMSCTYDCSACLEQKMNSGDENDNFVDEKLGDIRATKILTNETTDTLQDLLTKQGTVTLTTASHITADTTLSGGTIQRGDDHTGYLLCVDSGVTLTLTDITIDGRDITADKALIYVGEGATLMIGNGATITNGANTIVVNNIEASKSLVQAANAATNASGGTDYAGGVFVEGGEVILNGGSVTNNRGIFGGGIGGYCGNITVESGNISNNFARLCGGGICLFGTVTDTAFDVIVNGGQISSNSVGYGENEKLQSPKANGAGVYVSYANMTMTDGTISHNTNNNWSGGGIFIQAPTDEVDFNMTGGTVSDNFAQVSGGGIYLECGTVATIDGNSFRAIQITDNEAKGRSLTDGWYYYAGGGVYVNGGESRYNDAILTIKNVIVTKNESASNGLDSQNYSYTMGYGSGIGACGTSNIKIYITDGGAIYKNSSPSPSYPKSQLYILNQDNGFSCEVKISKYMLGGGLYNWMNPSETFFQDVSKATRLRTISLSAVPSAEDIEKAEEIATVIVSGNTTTSIGGGLAINGTMIMGREAYGDLTVSKTVSGNGADKSKEFTFTVTLGDTSINGTYEDMTFVNGSATFTLKDGENKTAKGLPAGIPYTVTEAEANQDGYTTTVNSVAGSTATGAIEADGTTEVKFINTKPGNDGNLTVSKTVSGSGADREKDFDFTVTLSDTALNGAYGEMNFENGVANFTLKAGESKTAARLPAGAEYTVTEADYSADGYTTTSTGNTAGTIAADETLSVTFNNHRETPTGSLTVSKIVSGSGADKLKDFTFTVTLSDKTISGIYGDMTFENGVANFTLKHEESKIATGLPADITYSVVESDNSGYTVTATGAEGMIVENETATAAFANYRGSSGGGGSDNPPPEDPKDPEEPEEPEEPTTPDEPTTPEEPGTPEEPNIPSEQGNPNDPEYGLDDPDVPKGGADAPEDGITSDGAPRTGDTAPTAVFAALLLAAAGGFAITRRKRNQ